MEYTKEIAKILDMGMAIYKEKDTNKILDAILDSGMEIANCDAGTLYMEKEGKLYFKVMKTVSMGIDKGKNGEEIDLPPVEMREENICAYTLLHKKILNIPDVYSSTEFDFSGPRRYDALTGYHTGSMLTIPLLNQEDEAVGVLQLLNSKDQNGDVVAFAPALEPIILSLASQATMALSNIRYAEEIKEQMWSFTEAMAEAIDARTPYNANHVRNVAVYAGMLADYINELHGDGKEEAYFDKDRKDQLVLSALLHDLGKMAIPTKVMNKATKMEEKLEDIRQRFSVIRLRYKIDFLEGRMEEEEYKAKVSRVDEVWELVDKVNQSGFLPDETEALLKEAFEEQYQDGEECIPFFTEEEKNDLLIKKGTLNKREREIMESHVEVTEKILSKVRFNATYKKAAQFAVEHHECLNGTGYPQKLSAEALELESRILAVADICDALLATDRPYKKPMPKEKAFAIMHDMANEGKIDGILVGYLEHCIS